MPLGDFFFWPVGLVPQFLYHIRCLTESGFTSATDSLPGINLIYYTIECLLLIQRLFRLMSHSVDRPALPIIL
jgi:hypothetical protein